MKRFIHWLGNNPPVVGILIIAIYALVILIATAVADLCCA